MHFVESDKNIFCEEKIVSDKAKAPPAYRVVRQGAFNAVSNDFNEQTKLRRTFPVQRA